MSIDDYRPHFMVEAVYDLKPDQLREHGIRAVLVDLDNTLIAWNNPDGTPELRAWLDEMTEADIPVVVSLTINMNVLNVRLPISMWIS